MGNPENDRQMTPFAIAPGRKVEIDGADPDDAGDGAPSDLDD